MRKQSVGCNRIKRRLEPFHFRISSERFCEKNQGNEINEEFHVSSNWSSVTRGHALATLGLVSRGRGRRRQDPRRRRRIRVTPKARSPRQSRSFSTMVALSAYDRGIFQSIR